MIPPLSLLWNIPPTIQCACLRRVLWLICRLSLLNDCSVVSLPSICKHSITANDNSNRKGMRCRQFTMKKEQSFSWSFSTVTVFLFFSLPHWEMGHCQKSLIRVIYHPTTIFSYCTIYSVWSSTIGGKWAFLPIRDVETAAFLSSLFSIFFRAYT